MKVGYPLIFSLFILAFLTSCTNTKEVTYFDINKDLVTDITNSSLESPIQKNDILSISVTSLSAEASQMYNAPNSSGGGSKDAIGGYLVSKEGFIQFPALGSIKAEGLTKS
jgi:polysaccharide export outer membrane protein